MRYPNHKLTQKGIPQRSHQVSLHWYAKPLFSKCWLSVGISKESLVTKVLASLGKGVYCSSLKMPRKPWSIPSTSRPILRGPCPGPFRIFFQLYYKPKARNGVAAPRLKLRTGRPETALRFPRGDRSSSLFLCNHAAGQNMRSPGHGNV